MKKRSRVVVVGSLVMDFVARGQRLPKSGETILGDLFGMFPGGKGANQAVQAGRLGAETYMVGCVGSDIFGEHLLRSLKESGVDTQFVRTEPSAKTAACCIHVDAQGNNSIVIVPEANSTCCRADIDRAAPIIESAEVLICQLEIPLATVEYALALAAKSNVRTILNPAPACELSDRLLSYVSILTPNESEAVALADSSVAGKSSTEDELARELLAKGPEAVVVTAGERGAFVFGPKLGRLVPAFAVQAVDTTAAGDAFNGALAVAIGEGRDLETAIRFANAAGALATTRAGAQPSLPWRPDVERLLGQHSGLVRED
jgi:ribokinase